MNHAERLIRWGRLRAALEGARAQLAAAIEQSDLLSAEDELWLKDVGERIKAVDQGASREEARIVAADCQNPPESTKA